MEKKDKISVIITTKNRLDFLKRAVNSVLKQSYEEIELVVVNDCSIDGTQEWLSKNENIDIVINNTLALGGNKSRNKGIEASTGTYIAFLDDDDIWLPQKIELQVNAIKKNPDSKLCYVDMVRTDGTQVYSKRGDGSIAVYDYSEKIFSCIPTVTSALLIEKNILLELGMFDEKLKYWQEYDLLIRLSQKTNFIYINRPLLIYWEPNSTRSSLSNKTIGFEENFTYINSKYQDKIKKISKSSKNAWYANYYYDLGIRYKKIGNREMAKKNFFADCKMKLDS